MTDTILRASNISKIYGKHKALDKVSLEIKRGMVYGIIGANGAGKSTFMRTVMGLINLDTREVLIDKETVHLTGREYAILLLLLEQPQKVFSRANLYESVWNEPFFDSDKTVNMHISNLRSKINSASRNYIKTVWGVGFKFD